LTNPAENGAILELLHRTLVLIRASAGNGDSKKCFALADAFEPLPMMSLAGARQEIGLEDFDRVYLEYLVTDYPDLVGLRAFWRERVSTAWT
jgi:hypothetical protein